MTTDRPPTDSPADVLILMPVYDDWDSVAQLLGPIDRALASADARGRVLLIDDRSPSPCGVALTAADCPQIDTLQVLTLRRNLGHQRAIAVGLAYAQQHTAEPLVIVMDGDGEDDPADIPQLIRTCRDRDEREIIFAARMKRSEGLIFRGCYRLYRYVHKLLTSQSVRFGNYSIIPRACLDSLVVVSELWNHYAAAVCKSRLPYASVPTVRGERLVGRSRMNFVSLVMHGLSAISVYSDTVGVRMLIASGLLGLLALAGIGTTVYVRVGTDLAIPGWATTATGVLAMVLLQAVAMSVLFVFLVLMNRNGAAFLPVRDYEYFVGRVRELP